MRYRTTYSLAAGVALMVSASFHGGAPRAPQAPADSASFVPDDNRGFQLDVPVATGETLLVHCAFYDRGAGGSEKRIIVYREGPARRRFGLAIGDGWTIAAECAARAGDASAERRGRIEIPSPIVLPLDGRAGEGKHDRATLLVIAWTRRANGHWAQLERYSVLEQRSGTMYQFGDFRVGCCLDAASAYVTRVRGRPRVAARGWRARG